MQTVILADEQGKPQGSCPVTEAHDGAGKLHLAFSVLVFRDGRSELLLQKRSSEKRLWPGHWSNTCCSHPRDEREDITRAAAQRLQEECGFTCPLTAAGSFVYQARDPAGSGTEHEHDTVLTGDVEGDVSLAPDPAEAAELRWVNVENLQRDLQEHPERYTPWFPQALAIALAA